MYYSLKELKENLTEKILSLGIKEEFIENPAFSSALSEIGWLLHNMEESHCLVKEEDGVIKIECTTTYDVKYSMKIWIPTPDTIRCVRIMEEKPFIGTNGKYVRTKHAYEIITNINNNNWIEVIENGSTINNIDCREGTTNNSVWARKKEYDPNGVMTTREYKDYKSSTLNASIDRATEHDMLCIPRFAFQIGHLMERSYNYRELLRRKYLDVARIVVEDKGNGIEYYSDTQLKGEHGYRNMVLMNGWNYPTEVVIKPLSNEEIENMIQLEINHKVQEGLRKFSQGREKYHYNSSEDLQFSCRGLNLDEGKRIK